MEAYEIKNAVESIKLSEEAKKRILDASLACAEGEGRWEKPRTKRINLRRSIIAAIAAVMLLSITAYASNGEMGSWNAKETGRKFRELPTAEYCLARLGYVPLMTESFENGYSFTGGGIEDKSFTDKSGGVIEEYVIFPLPLIVEAEDLLRVCPVHGLCHPLAADLGPPLVPARGHRLPVVQVPGVHGAGVVVYGPHLAHGLVADFLVDRGDVEASRHVAAGKRQGGILRGVRAVRLKDHQIRELLHHSCNGRVLGVNRNLVEIREVFCRRYALLRKAVNGTIYPLHFGMDFFPVPCL